MFYIKKHIKFIIKGFFRAGLFLPIRLFFSIRFIQLALLTLKLCLFFVSLFYVIARASPEDFLEVENQGNSSFDERSTNPLDVSSLEKAVYRMNVGIFRVGITMLEKRATAFAIGPNLFVTSFHFFEKYLTDKSIKTIRISNSQGRFQFDKLLRISKKHDLALFTIKGEVKHYLEIAPDSVPLEKPSFFIGYPEGFFTREAWYNIPYHVMNQSYVIPSTSVRIGASGSPVFNKRGQVIAIAYQGWEVWVLKTLLAGIKSKYLQDLIEGKLGFDCSNLGFKLCIKKELNNFKKETQDRNEISKDEYDALEGVVKEILTDAVNQGATSFKDILAYIIKNEIQQKKSDLRYFASHLIIGVESSYLSSLLANIIIKIKVFNLKDNPKNDLNQNMTHKPSHNELAKSQESSQQTKKQIPDQKNETRSSCFSFFKKLKP